MTEYRYFMNHFGEVFREDASGPFVRAFDVSGNPKYTEVQVAPIDAIVIRRGELPEVHANTGVADLEVDGHTFDHFESVEAAEDYLHAVAAIVQHLREHPPVDDAQVQALRRVIADDFLVEGVTTCGGESSVDILARRIVERFRLDPR